MVRHQGAFKVKVLSPLNLGMKFLDTAYISKYEASLQLLFS